MKPIIDARWKWIWGAVLAFAWTSVVVLFVKNNGNLSVQELLNYQPESTALALLTMAGLFLLKSVDFLMHSGVLYAANGIMFPLPVALLLNTLGAAIMVTPTYWIGRTMGAPALRYIAEKHPKIASQNRESIRYLFQAGMAYKSFAPRLWAAIAAGRIVHGRCEQPLLFLSARFPYRNFSADGRLHHHGDRRW